MTLPTILAPTEIEASTPAPYCPGDAPLQSCSTLPWITAARACSSTTHERPASFKLPGPTREPGSAVEYPRRITVPETSSGTELFAAVSSTFARVRYRVASVVSIPFARTARGPPGPLVIVMRPLAALPLVVIVSRWPKVEPGTRQPVCPGASDFASRSSDCSGLAFVPGFVSAPLGAAQRLQRTATGLPPATPTSTLETMIAATTGAPLSTVEV